MEIVIVALFILGAISLLLGIAYGSNPYIMVALSSLLAAALFLTGCTVQQPRPQVATTPTPIVQAAPQPELWQPVYQPEPPRPVRLRSIEPMASGGKTITFRAGEKYTLYCPETGTLTIKFPAGETIQDFGVGASGEWIVDKKKMGIDLPIGVIVIGRTPFAPSAELHVITDAEVYQFILIPQEGGVRQKQATLFQIVNLDTEARRAERQQRRMEVAEMERREREPEVPRLDAASIRTYQVSGDAVPWRPLSVVGDNQRTVIQLPAGIATQPTLTAIADGKEIRINARTVLLQDGHGPRIVADQPLGEAKLIGEGGSIVIRGGN